MYLQPVDKQSLLDSGILCCLIHILNSLLGPNEGYLRQKVSNDEELLQTEENKDNVESSRRLEVPSYIITFRIFGSVPFNTIIVLCIQEL